MSFFDQPYYALTKAHMSRMGIWPEQSKYVRIIRLLTMFALTMTIAGPMFVRLYDTWGNIHALMRSIPHLLIGAVIILTVLRYIQHFQKIKLSFKNIERHWGMFKNTSAVCVLDKYAERGRYIIVVYSIYIYVALTLYLALSLSPIILDFVNPLNETRPKINMFNTDYGVDVDKYYWFILAHEYIVTTVAISMMMAIETMYFLWAAHACALFEVVGFNLKLITNKCTANQENEITLCTDWNYNQICDCITYHEEAIRFADLIESICSGPFGAVLSFIAIMIIFTSVQALINLNHPEVLMQLATYAFAQVFHLYINSIPGQELMNHSQKIHTTAYNLEWHEMSVKAQKLLIPIMIRSNKPCRLTARKVYVLSMESFVSTIRTVISYFTIFAQLI